MDELHSSLCADLIMNDKQLTMEIDTGAAVSLNTE